MVGRGGWGWAARNRRLLGAVLLMLLAAFIRPVAAQVVDDRVDGATDLLDFEGLTHLVALGGENDVSTVALEESAEAIGGASVARVEGADLYDTAARASEAFGPGGSVILTTGERYADALSASPLALSLQAPILLTRQGALPEPTGAALERLAPAQVVIAGGFEAVSLAVEEAVRDLGVPLVRRVDGPNRWATSQKISAMTHPDGARTVYVSNGGEWLPTLPGMMAASAVDAPLLLVRADAISTETEAALDRLQPAEVVILGNEDSVGHEVEQELAAYAPEVRRIGGATLFDIASNVALDTWRDGAEMAFIASADSFGNALVAAPLMSQAARGQLEGFGLPGLPGLPVPGVDELVDGAGLFHGAASGPNVPGGPLLLARSPDDIPLDPIDELDDREEDHDDCVARGDCPAGPPANAAPTAVDDVAATDEDTVAVIDVLANDTDADGAALQLVSVGAPALGTATIVAGQVQYTPGAAFDHLTAGQSEVVTFSYAISDGSVLDAGQVSVTVNGLGLAPIGVADQAFTVSIQVGPVILVPVTVPVLVNDSDPDGLLIDLRVDAVDDAASVGTAEVTLGGLGVLYTPGAGDCTIADVGEVHTDTFTYDVRDADGHVTAGVPVTVDVSCLLGLPDALDDLGVVAEDALATTLIPSVLTNDPNGSAITAVTQPANGTAAITNGGADVSYQPDPDYCNNGLTTDDFTYTVVAGGTATVRMTVLCLPDAAVPVPDLALVNEDPALPVAIPVLDNDLDIDGGGISITGVTQPANGVVTIAPGGASLSYLPDPDYCNALVLPDGFTYTITGGLSTTVSVTVLCLNDLPVAIDDAINVLEDGLQAGLAVLTNDTDLDPSDVLTIQSVDTSLLTGGSVTIAPDGLSLSFDPLGAFEALGVGQTLPQVVTYVVQDGNGGTDQGTLTLTVTGVNDAPTALGDVGATVASALTGIGVPTVIFPLLNDLDVDTLLANLTVTGLDLTGTAGSAVIGLAGAVTYTPAAAMCGGVPIGQTVQDTFGYVVGDGAGGSAAQTVTVTVTCLGL